MTFLYPWALLLLAGLPFAYAGLLGAERRRRAQLERFGDPALLARSSRMPDPGLRLRAARTRVIALALLITALARPQLGERASTLPHSGRDLLVLLDISRSMGAPDGAPTRMAAAKRAALDLVARLPGDRVGLIVFGGSAFLQLPLVRDHAAFKLFIDAASNQYLYDPSTDVAAALKAALAVFEHEGSHGSRAIILLSDGETQPEAVLDATVALQRENIPVIAIGVGTPEGSPVPADSTEAPEKWHRDRIGRVVNSRLEEGVMSRLAHETGGAYLRWREGADLGPLVTRIKEVQARVLEAGAAGSERADRFQWPLAAGVLLLVVELFLGWRIVPAAVSAKARSLAVGRPGAGAGAGAATASARTVLLLIGVSLLLPGCMPADREARRGARLYADNQWRESFEAFQRSIDAGAGHAVEYDAGNALYRMHHYEDAIKRYQILPDDSTRLYRAARFNLGNAYVRAAEEANQDNRGTPLRLAIAAFEEVLRMDPHDTEAKWNLELAVRRLGDQAGDGSPNRGRRADYGRGQMDDPNKEGNAQQVVGAMAGGGFGSMEGESAKELTEEQARRLLESVEREQANTHEGRPNAKGRPGGKDW
jgi:Ca-activated chloride channel family protein